MSECPGTVPSPSQPTPMQPSGVPPNSSPNSSTTSTQAAPAQPPRRRAQHRPFFDSLKPIGFGQQSQSISPQEGGISSVAVCGSGASAASPPMSRTTSGHALRQHRVLVMTPGEREINKVSKSNRPLSELEILQLKHESEFKQIVPAVAEALQTVMNQHTQIARTAARDDRYSYYETNSVPSIPFQEYVQRISDFTYISPATLIGTLIILDRLCDRHPTLHFTQLNLFKLFFVGVRVASKVVDLRTLNNKNFANVGGISNRHLNEIESRFLIDLRFGLYISPREFYTYVHKMMGSSNNSPNSTIQSVPRNLPAVAVAKQSSGSPANNNNSPPSRDKDDSL